MSADRVADPPAEDGGSPATSPRRGRLKVYLGTVAGSGKTFAMLHEGHERRALGEDVVVGFVETHGRARTAEAVGSLEVIPRIHVPYNGAQLEEMNLSEVLRRRPQVVLIDELAHTNAPGLRHEKRWQDVETVRRAGIDVITTLNVQHLESVKDVVRGITGITVHETVPDGVLDGADDLRFIDITPAALRKRMLHGNIYPPEQIETALDNFFRPANLAALRELGLGVVADRIDPGTVARQPQDVLVAISGRPGSAQLVRRAVRIARRYRGFCAVLHVHGRESDHHDEWRSVAAALECSVIEVSGRSAGDVVDAIIATAHARSVSHLVIGESGVRERPFWSRGIVDQIVAKLVDCDLHVIARHGPPSDDSERPGADDLLRRLKSPSAGGTLRLYLGYAPGCGTSTALLAEAVRRHSRGADIVIGVAPKPENQGAGIAVVGGMQGPAGNGRLDLQAVLARNPEVCCVDDVAGLTVGGDVIASVVPALRAAGITVLGTLCLVDMHSVASVVPQLARPPGAGPALDDSILNHADEVELIDVTPLELQDRLRRGRVIPLSRVAMALQGVYRIEVLEMLRELAFRWVARLSDRNLLDYMDRAAIHSSWEARPRVLVCIRPEQGIEAVIRGAAALAARRDNTLTVLSVRDREYTDEEKFRFGECASLTHRLGGDFVSLYDSDVPQAIVRYAREHRITELVVQRSRTRGSHRLRAIIAALDDVDVHVLAAVD